MGCSWNCTIRADQTDDGWDVGDVRENLVFELSILLVRDWLGELTRRLHPHAPGLARRHSPPLRVAGPLRVYGAATWWLHSRSRGRVGGGGLHDGRHGNWASFGGGWSGAPFASGRHDSSTSRFGRPRRPPDLAGQEHPFSGEGTLAITNNSSDPITEVSAHVVVHGQPIELRRADHIRAGGSLVVLLPRIDGAPRVEWSDADGKLWRRDRIGAGFQLRNG